MTGAQPNDLYDRRDLLLDQLSTHGPGLGHAVAGRQRRRQPRRRHDRRRRRHDRRRDGAGRHVPAELRASPGGKLGALLDLQSATGPIGSYQTDLAATAQSLADSVNGIYAHGTGTNFFTFGAGASGLPQIASTSRRSRRPRWRRPRRPGDNTLALRSRNLRGGDADKRYQQLVTRMGNEVSRGRAQATAQVLTDNLKDRRESVSGVSLDEEMTNIIRFQRAYQASARAMSTTDEMLDTLINRAGRVGL